VIFCFQPYYSFTLVLYLTYHLFLHLLITNHKCTHPCYFHYLLKPTSQKMKTDKNSSIRSSRLALPWLLSYGLWCLPLFCFHKSHLSLWRYYLCNNLYFIQDIWLSLNTFCPYVWNKYSWAHMHWLFDFGIKSGMTSSDWVHNLEVLDTGMVSVTPSF
jgi:hypothetical protein